MNRYFLQALYREFRFELPGGILSLGRSPENRLVVPEASVSGRHAELKVLEGGGVWVRDLESTNGTFVDGQPVTDVILQAGQAIQFGTVEFRLEAERVEIRVPVVEQTRVAAAGQMGTLRDGSLACSRNPELPATHQAHGGCAAVVRCPGVFNVASLRAMALAGGKQGVLLFCPDCNARCEPIQGVPEAALTDTKAKRGFLARLTQTIRLGRWQP